jgi:hypothetical protein
LFNTLLLDVNTHHDADGVGSMGSSHVGWPLNEALSDLPAESSSKSSPYLGKEVAAAARDEAEDQAHKQHRQI